MLTNTTTSQGKHYITLWQEKRPSILYFRIEKKGGKMNGKENAYTVRGYPEMTSSIGGGGD